jgi:hypothetical protein
MLLRRVICGPTLTRSRRVRRCAQACLSAQLLSDAMGDDVCGRLGRAWRVLIVALVPSESVPYFREFLARVAAHLARPEQS